ncbi:Guanine nucleotide-binding protein G(i) subunit alpha-2 [Kappamyces sp. JEL0829]|nr:Guanine nucleotide-binding protein G(i) subunit alpha-2 [Kappamyces sp. JEL0829]
MSETAEEKKLAAKRASMVEAYLAQEKQKYLEYKLEPKLLILGSSDSGKSTLLKQLKILHGGGFGEAETRLSRHGILTNIITACIVLIGLCPEVKDTYQDLFDFQEEWDTTQETIPPEIRDLCVTAWRDPAVQEAFTRTPEHQLPDTTE